jgi:hypothetical protein
VYEGKKWIAAMANVIICSLCGQPLRLIQKPDGSTVLVCDCPGKEVKINDIGRLLGSGELDTHDDGKK